MILNLKSALSHADEACHGTFIKSPRLIHCLTIDLDKFYDKQGEHERGKGRSQEIHLLIEF